MSTKPRGPAYNKGILLEKIAADYLQTKGLVVLQHNFNCCFGEIDLICQHQNELVFVEVRYRKNTEYGTPEETITFAKQKKLLLTAQHYLIQNTWTTNSPCRLDVIAITVPENYSDFKEYICNIIDAKIPISQRTEGYHEKNKVG